MKFMKNNLYADISEYQQESARNSAILWSSLIFGKMSKFVQKIVHIPYLREILKLSCVSFEFLRLSLIIIVKPMVLLCIYDNFLQFLYQFSLERAIGL